MKWMLFIHEPTEDHYFFNGKFAIRVYCQDPESNPDLIEFTDANLKEMAKVAETPRKQLMVLNKVRYNVLSRGALIIS